MECKQCLKTKLSKEFSTLRKIGPSNFGYDLNRYCLRCLEVEVLKENGKFSVVVSNENKVIIQNECDGLDGSKKYVGKYEMEYRKKVHDEVHIIFMNGERFSVPVTKQTTIKDIKIYLGKLQQREPRYYRLLLNSIELKVRNEEDGTANLLLNFSGPNINGLLINGILPYGNFVGQNTVKNAPIDQFGNVSGSIYDLGVDGAYAGYTVAIIEQYDAFQSLCNKALIEKGFTILKLGASPTLDDLNRALEKACQLWLISGDRLIMTDAHIQSIKSFYEKGRGLFIWGDNVPWYYDSNRVLKSLFGDAANVHMEGNDEAQKVLQAKDQANPNSSGFEAKHILFTGVAMLFEGVTIARVRAPVQTNIKTIMVNSHGNPVTCILDDGKHRLVIDGGFTRLFDQFWSQSAGTGRFVKNMAAWLCGVDSDWV